MFGWAGVTSEADNVTTTRGIFTDVGLQREVGTATRGSLNGSIILVVTLPLEHFYMVLMV